MEKATQILRAGRKESVSRLTPGHLGAEAPKLIFRPFCSATKWTRRRGGGTSPLVRTNTPRIVLADFISFAFCLAKGSFISSLVLSKSHPFPLGCDLGPLRRAITPPTSGRLRPDKSALGLCPSAPESLALLPGAQTHKFHFPVALCLEISQQIIGKTLRLFLFYGIVSL